MDRKKGLIMDKVKARKMYELATRLSSVNASELTEQQLSERNSMISRLQEEMQKMREGTTTQTATGVRHQASPGVYGGSDEEEDPDTELKKNFVNKADKAFGVKWDRENKKAPSIKVEAGVDTDQATHYNVNKLGGEIGVDPRVLRVAIQRSMLGNPTRQDTMTLADAFLGILKNGDDQTIQNIANIIKSGNPRKEVPQESTASIAERNAFVDAMRQVKKGDKFTVGGKEFTKTTSHGTMDKEEVKEEINTEAYDRLRKVFDFSNYKG
jgi:hypothetical protein